MRSKFNLILLAIVGAFVGYEVTVAAVDEPGADQTWTLSEWVWAGGLWTQIPAALITAWATLHFIAPQYDPFLRFFQR